ncbi:MAG TPA: GreA/GreB family elongation factor [Candidatus Polarisedimenticolaceae bacterium]|nr:GreA/GreB family elongation factor [Candidatus Polarisedimenticolaceae bacterium]
MERLSVTVTDVDSHRLRRLIADPPSSERQETRSLERLEEQLSDAEVLPAIQVGPDVVTIGSLVRVRDLDTQRRRVFRVVLPGSSDADAGRISVLAPLGGAVLGRSVGDDVVWRAPGGLRRLRVEAIPYQPEREGLDLA